MFAKKLRIECVYTFRIPASAAGGALEKLVDEGLVGFGLLCSEAAETCE